MYQQKSAVFAAGDLLLYFIFIQRKHHNDVCERYLVVIQGVQRQKPKNLKILSTSIFFNNIGLLRSLPEKQLII